MAIPLLLLFVAITTNFPLPTVEEIENAIIDYRREYVPGSATWHCQQRGETRYEGKIELNSQYRVDIDGTNLRIDVRGESHGRMPFHEYSILISRDQIVFFKLHDSSIYNTPRTFLYGKNERDKIEYHSVQLDSIGLLSEPFGFPRPPGQMSAAEVLRHQDVIRKNVVSEDFANEKVYRTTVEFRSHGNNIIRHQSWIAPKKGYAVLKSEMKYLGTPNEPGATLTARYEQFPPNNRWFPRQIHIDYFEEGKIEREENVTVTAASLGAAPPKRRFELDDLGIPESTPVIKNGERYFWDGKSLASSHFLSSHSDTPRSPYRFSSFVVGVLATTLALLLIVRLRQQKHSRAHQFSQEGPP